MYNYESYGDNTVLDCSLPPEDLQPILCEEVEIATPDPGQENLWEPRWFGHVSRSSGLAQTILQGTVKGKRKRSQQKQRWEDKIKEWTGMDSNGPALLGQLKTGKDGEEFIHGAPTTLQGYGIE